MSFARKMQRRRVRAPGDAQCAECGKPPELGVTSPTSGRILLYCRPCARELGKTLNLPSLLDQLNEDEPS
jgi:recombinational DNA repair protein (RecF pathway)